MKNEKLPISKKRFYGNVKQTLLVLALNLLFISFGIAQNLAFYGASDDTDELIVYNNFLETTTVIGSFNTTSVEAMKFNPDFTTLYGISGGTIGEINLLTGNFSPTPNSIGANLSGSIGNVNVTNVEAMTFDPISGQLYVAASYGNNNLLIKVNPNTGSFIAGAFAGNDYVVIQQSQGNGNEIEGMAISYADGTLYAIENNGNSRLIAINKNNGLIYVVGDIYGGGVGYLKNLEALSVLSDGRLFATSGSDNTIYEINNQNAKVVRVVGYYSSGGDFDGSAAIMLEDSYLHDEPSCGVGSAQGKIDWSNSPSNSDEFNWNPSGALSKTLTNVSGTGIDVAISFSGDTNSLDFWNGSQTPNVGTGNGREALQYYSNGFWSGINITLNFSEPVDAVGFDLTHINYFKKRGDKYTITAITELGNTIYPTFNSAPSPAYTTDNFGNVNAVAYCGNGVESSSDREVGVNFSSSEKIISINLFWQNCESCGENGHGSGIWDIEFCKSSPIVDVEDDVSVTFEDAPVTIPIYDNDNEIPTQGTLTTTNPANGTLTINNNGTPNDPSDDIVTYTPNPDFNGTDTFNYTVCDNETPQNCDTAIVVITITPVLDLVEDFSQTPVDTPIVINIYSNDGDVPTIGTFTATNPTFGIVQITDPNNTPNNPSDNVVTYIPNTNFTGEDFFYYTICDNATPQNCDTARVTITVTGMQDFGPVIFTGNTTVIGASGVIDFRVLVGEFGGGNSNGIDPVELRIVKNAKLSISFNPTLTSLDGQPVSNSQWEYDGTHPSLHKFVYIGNGGIFNANTAQIIGINAVYFSPENSSGLFPLKATVKFFSGGETNNTNNNDIDFIEYTNN